MAKTLGPGLSLECRGSVGPLTYSRSPSGSFVRGWIDERNRNTFLQTEDQRLIFGWCNKLWNNESSDVVESWWNFSRSFTVSDRFGNGITHQPRWWFFKFNIPLLKYVGTYLYMPPLSPTCDYHPLFDLVWTASGFSLSWSPAIPLNNRIIVRQRRNLNASQMAPKRGSLSHILTESDSSPQLITPAAGGPGGPMGQPAFNGGSWMHFHILTMDDYGRTSPVLFYRLQAS